MSTNGKSKGSRTITIDRDAYDRLQIARGEGESVSEVIKRCVYRRRTAQDVIEMFGKVRVSDEVLQAAEESANRRRKKPYRPKV